MPLVFAYFLQRSLLLKVLFSIKCWLDQWQNNRTLVTLIFDSIVESSDKYSSFWRLFQEPGTKLGWFHIPSLPKFSNSNVGIYLPGLALGSSLTNMTEYWITTNKKCFWKCRSAVKINHSLLKMYFNHRKGRISPASSLFLRWKIWKSFEGKQENSVTRTLDCEPTDSEKESSHMIQNFREAYIIKSCKFFPPLKFIVRLSLNVTIKDFKLG